MYAKIITVDILDICIVAVAVFLTGIILVLALPAIKREDWATGSDFVLRQPKKYLWFTLIFLPAGIVAVGMIVWDERSPSQAALWVLLAFIFFALVTLQNYRWAIIVRGDTLSYVTTFGATKEFNFTDFSLAEISPSGSQQELILYLDAAKQKQAVSITSYVTGYDLLLARIERENIKIERP